MSVAGKGAANGANARKRTLVLLCVTESDAFKDSRGPRGRRDITDTKI